LFSIEIFRGSQHQDAQEFLNFLLNSISESLSNYQNKLVKRWDQFVEDDNKKKAKEMKKNNCKCLINNIYIFYLKKIINIIYTN